MSQTQIRAHFFARKTLQRDGSVTFVKWIAGPAQGVALICIDKPVRPRSASAGIGAEPTDAFVMGITYAESEFLHWGML